MAAPQRHPATGLLPRLGTFHKGAFLDRKHSLNQDGTQRRRTLWVRAFRMLLRDERGSLSVLIIGLFIMTVASIMVVSDISAMVIAKKALSQKTEYLAERGSTHIDLNAYYQGRGGLFPYLAEKLFVDQTDPGIPLDCSKVTAEVLRTAPTIRDSRFSNFDLTFFRCHDDTMEIHTRASALLPFTFGIFHLDNPEITAYAASAPERRNGFWIRGFRLW